MLSIFCYSNVTIAANSGQLFA